MEIKIELMAFIDRPENVNRIFSKRIDPNTTIQSLLLDLGFSQQSIRQMQFFVSNLEDNVKTDRVRRQYILQDEDQLFITLPIGGG